MPRSVRKKNTGALIALLAATALLTGCSQSEPSASPTPPVTGTPSEAPTGTPPTAEQTAWAGDVCSSTTTLKTDVQGLLSTAAGGDDVSARLNTPMQTIKRSAAALADTIKAVPKGSEDDPELAAVSQSSDEFGSSISDLETSVGSVEGAGGPALVVALASVASDAGTALVALAATTAAIGTAAADGTSSIGQAFKAAPECEALNR